MKNSTLGILMLFCFNTFAQKTTDSLEIWTMFTIGNLVNAKAHEFAARGLPVKIIHKTGDVLWEVEDEDAEYKSEIEYIEAHNDSVWEQLKNRGFKNPRKSYEEQFQKERADLEAALELFNENPRIKRYQEVRSKDQFPNADIKKITDGVYQIELWSLDIQNPLDTQKKEFVAKVDINTLQTTVVKLE
ncbi:hypothetical protein [Leeuwenhoekiella nanhaiensis]|uniref:Uncharacterized protein n=1 Tax=Leeuwenhoekiella nanhaiensis TaxID=1655491 RepID=A0A2G1VSR7_9FLAO|nr:hypothetical protein [Leeuwenhoekiella nanhaiensis]PHQ29791.1 hypothetical protein CJ305_07410 [Leeuwenhoekiella nanhaiensis]